MLIKVHQNWILIHNLRYKLSFKSNFYLSFQGKREHLSKIVKMFFEKRERQLQKYDKKILFYCNSSHLKTPREQIFEGVGFEFQIYLKLVNILL